MSGPEPQVHVLLCTAPVEEAPRLADRLLEEEWIACANLIGPVQSRYRWQGEVEQAEETVLLMKSSADPQGLRRRIAELHSYNCPEILELAVDGGLPEYLAWVRSNCKGSD